jgi:hypothetical protein
MKLATTGYAPKDFSSSFVSPEQSTSGLLEVKEKKMMNSKDRGDWSCSSCQESYNSGKNRSPWIQCWFYLNWYHENCQSVDLNNPPTAFMWSECSNVEAIVSDSESD